jgi:outer membrane protein assembly factor BamB
MKYAVTMVTLSWMAAADLGIAAAAQSPRPTASGEDRTAGAEEKQTVEPAAPVAGASQPPGQDFLAAVVDMNSPKHPVPEPDFRAGHVQNLEFNPESIKKTRSGFAIQMPSGTAVATPAVKDGRLYVSGGFSCMEFYCFDAKTGAFIWGKELDDDGASAPLVYDDVIIFNTESCTIFALDAAKGDLLWAHWLGDPLMSVPTAAGGRVYTTYPVEEAAEIGKFERPADAGEEATKPEKNKNGGKQSEKDKKPIIPTHVLICFHAKTGKVLWQRWIDTECMSAPVAVDDRLYVTTLSGTLYEVRQADGKILAARRLRTTSAPVAVGRYLYYTRRTDSEKEGEKISEAIVRLDRTSGLEVYLTCSRPAPYLDWRVQVEAKSTVDALEMEGQNAIMGGFGGGFGAGPGGGSGDGFFAVPPEQFGHSKPADEPEIAVQEPLAPAQQGGAAKVSAMDEPPQDLLAVTERVAAEVIGQGNVSMLQSYHGSRVLPLGDRNVACMGDLVVCVSARTGKLLWSVPLEGDLEEDGGYLASPPVTAGGQVFLSTLAGEVLQIDPQTGKKARSYKIGSPMRYPPLVVDGRIYATTQDGKVVCVDTGNQQLTGWPEWCHDPAQTNVH